MTYYGRVSTGLGKGGRGRKILAGREGGSYTARTGLVKYYKPGYERTNPYYRAGKSSEPELKFLDTAINLTFPTNAVCSTSAATGNIHIVPEGTGMSTREGRKINIRSIQLRGVFNLAPVADAQASSVAYLYLILDTQCNLANPAITDVFTTNAMGTNFLNLTNDKRFRILKKWKVPMSSTAGVSGAYNQMPKCLEWYKRCNIPITYDDSIATTGAIATTRQNSIFMAQGSATDDQIAFTGACRIRFTG